MKIKLFNTVLYYTGIFSFLNKKLIIRILRSSYLLRKKKPRFMMKIWEDLSSTKIIIKEKNISKFIYGRQIKNIEIYTRQKILGWIGGFKLNKLLLVFYSFNKKIIFPLPKEFQKVLYLNGFTVNKISILLLYVYSLFEIFLSFLIVFKIIFFEFKNKNMLETPYVYFDNLNQKNFPINLDVSSEKFNLITWYKFWPGREKVDVIKYGPKNFGNFEYGNFFICNQPFKLPALSVGEKFLFIVWYFLSLSKAVISLFTGNWINAFNFTDALLLKKISLLKDKFLAKDYLFSFSQYMKRPLWTYEAESRGAKITLFNYAASSGGFKSKSGYPHLDLGISSMTWPRIITWSKHNTNYLKDNISYPTRFESSLLPVNFTDDYYDLNKVSKNYICVFDVAPYRKLFRAIWCSEEIIYDFPYVSSFLKDVFDVCSKNKINVIWKKKKIDSDYTPTGYKNLINENINSSYVHLANPNIAASRLIKNCKGVISMPFTSTAVIANIYNKPSIFYDPKNVIYDDDRGAGGNIILHDKKKLEEWILNKCF